jgi:hypothetical protein
MNGLNSVNLPELRAAGLIVAGLMVAPSAPFGWVEYIRGEAMDDGHVLLEQREDRGEARWCLQNDVS